MESIRVLVLNEDEGVRQSIRAAFSALTTRGYSVVVFEAPTLARACEIGRAARPALVVVDLATAESSARSLIEAASAGGRPAHVIATFSPSGGSAAGAEAFLGAVRTGVSDFLRIPPVPDDVEAVIRKLFGSPEQISEPKRVQKREGKIIAVFSHKGGVGKTSISVNLSCALARMLRASERHVALVDTALQLGNAATFLDLEPEYTLHDAIRSLARLDEALLGEYLEVHESGVSFLDAPRRAPEAGAITDDQVSQVLILLRSMFPLVVVDMFPMIDSINLATMDLANTVLVVTEAVTPIVRGTKRCLEVIDQLDYAHEKVRLVLNRYSQFAGNCRPQAVAEALERDIDYVIPYDRRIVTCANDGIPYAMRHPKGPISVALNTIAKDILGEERPRSLLSRLFGSGRNGNGVAASASSTVGAS